MLELPRLHPTDQIVDIPSVINEAFEAIEEAINPILRIIDVTTKTINLSDLQGTIPNKSIIADNIILTGANGNVLVVSPNGSDVKASIDKEGNITPSNVPSIAGDTDTQKLSSVISALRTLGFVQ